MKLHQHALVPAALALLAAAGAIAHVRLVNPANGNKLFWSSPSNVSIVINATGSDDITDGSHFTSLRNAIDAWNRAGGSTAHLAEDSSPAQQARTDWDDDALHLLFFDETNSSGYFPGGSGTVALTPIWFLSSGLITDADVLFNGSGFDFTTQASPGAFDLQDVATHELGHLLGLDHTGWAGATMYPYVDTTVILHRSLALDDARGIRDAYPSGAFASITGTIRRQSDGTAVAGAHVVACDAQGRTAAGALADNSGVFQLRALSAETYSVYATPLDYPVSSANLGAGHTVQTDFESTALAVLTPIAGQTLVVGDLMVEPDVAISLGRSSDRYPMRCIAGQTVALVARGAGLDAGSTLASSDASITIAPTAWLSTQVNFTASVPAGATIGHADLVATNLAGERSILPAALEITPPNPGVATVNPASGPTAGGTNLTIGGAGFQPDARVVIGENVYVDGDAGGCTVVDASTITLSTLPTAAGTWDVVVLDASGVEGRKTNAFQTAAQPSIQTIFPVAGYAAGGTSVVIRGASFLAGVQVRIDGVPQAQVTVDDPTRLTVVTGAGVPGGPYVVEVENPGGFVATSAFTYSNDPDPAIASVDPAGGTTSGGDTLTITGSNLQPTSDVWFGADPDTGLGGVLAASFTWIDASTIEVVTPAHASGATSVMVLDNLTGQATVLADAFTFTAQSGGGGGGCSVAPLHAPPSPWDPLIGGWWLLALLVILSGRARRETALQASIRDPK